MMDLWSEEKKFGTWLVVELAVIQAREKLGTAPAGAAELIRAHAKIDVARIEELERPLGHDMNAFVEQIRESLRGTPAEHLADEIHREVTSYDVEDPAVILLLREAVALVLLELQGFCGALRVLAAAHQWTLMIARTHGQPARPDTFGRMLAPLIAQIERCIERLEQTRRTELCEGKISGAVGNYAGMNPELEAETLAILGLKPAAAETQILGRDRHAAVLSALADAAATIAQIAETFWIMMHGLIGELREPFGARQMGSSAMPQKKNPITIEQMMGMAMLVLADAAVAKQMIASQRECRIIHHSCVERHIFPRATALVHYMAIRMKGIVEGMTVFPDQMKENLDRTYETWAAEDLREALVRAGVGDHDAYRYAQRISGTAKERRVTMSEVSRTTPLSADATGDQRPAFAILGEEAFAAVFDPMPVIHGGVVHVFEQMAIET